MSDARPLAARFGLHPFAWPAAWLGVWLFGWLICIYVSLMRDPPMPDDVPDIDKVFHALAYAILSAWAALLFARARGRWRTAASLIALGWALELAQGELTTWRSMDAWDGVADTLGVLLGQGLALATARTWLCRLEQWLLAGHRRWLGRD